MQDKDEADDCSGQGQGKEDAAMFPVEVMPLAQWCSGVARVEQPIADVEGPRGKREHDGEPDGQVNAGSAGEGQCPDDGDGGCVEAGQVPQAHEMPETDSG